MAAPGTPERQPVLAATTAAAGVQQPGPEPENPQPQQAGLRAARQHPPQQQASHEVQIFECEPRQQLLWSIAGRATSMSWQGGAAAAGAPAAGAGPAGLSPAVAVPAVAVQPATCDSLPAAAPAAAEAVLGLPSDAAPAVLPVKYRGSLERSCWTELQPEMLAVVLAQAGVAIFCIQAVSLPTRCRAGTSHGSSPSTHSWLCSRLTLPHAAMPALLCRSQQPHGTHAEPGVQQLAAGRGGRAQCAAPASLLPAGAPRGRQLRQWQQPGKQRSERRWCRAQQQQRRLPAALAGGAGGQGGQCGRQRGSRTLPGAAGAGWRPSAVDAWLRCSAQGRRHLVWRRE